MFHVEEEAEWQSRCLISSCQFHLCVSVPCFFSSFLIILIIFMGLLRIICFIFIASWYSYLFNIPVSESERGRGTTVRITEPPVCSHFYSKCQLCGLGVVIFSVILLIE